MAADAVSLASSSNPGAAASILASDASGYLTLVRLIASDRVRTPLLVGVLKGAVMVMADLARELREAHADRPRVLVAVTGWGQPDDRRRTAEAGFDHHLVKPPDLEVLREVCASVLPWSREPR